MLISFMERAIELSLENVLTKQGGPFGAVIVKDNIIIAEGTNLVTATNDPTAHAEIVAIRAACNKLNSFQLTDCTIYSSCEPCPMCLGAIYWARPVTVYFANSHQDAARIGFDDSFIYRELQIPQQERSIKFIKLDIPKAREAFHAWEKEGDKITY